MELENEIPPPPYSEVDPSTTTPETSIMGGGDYSPTSTLRPTSSQSMRAPSFITLRGGYLRGVPYSDDVAIGTYFQERAFEYNPNRQLTVLHREITADTSRNDLPFPEFDRDQDVTEQDWQTFVNYILTELGNETSVRHRKQLTPEEFYERQTKLEQVVMEWNEAFFQPRSIKFIAHYYYKHPKDPSQDKRRKVRKSEPKSKVRRIPIEDGVIDAPRVDHGTRSVAHHPPHVVHHSGPFSGGIFGRGRGTGMRGRADAHHRHGSGDYEHARRQRDSSSSSSSSESSSSLESESDGRRGTRRGDRRGRRDHRREERRRRHNSTSSESSFTSVSSMSSDDMDERSIGIVREAIANFRLDPTNNQHNKLAYRQLLQEVRNKQRQSLATGLLDTRSIRGVTKAQCKAIRDDLKSIRNEAKSIQKRTKDKQREEKRKVKAAHKEAKAARKQSRKIARDAQKSARKAMKQARSRSDNVTATARNLSQVSNTTPVSQYHVPGSFPELPADEVLFDQKLYDLESRIGELSRHIVSLTEDAERETKDITQPEKKKLARASYDEEIRETQKEIKRLKEEMRQYLATKPVERGQSTSQARQTGNSYGDEIGQRGEQFGRHIEALGQRFGRDMEAWGENFGREMERWGTDLGRRLSERGEQIGRRFG